MDGDALRQTELVCNVRDPPGLEVAPEEQVATMARRISVQIHLDQAALLQALNPWRAFI